LFIEAYLNIKLILNILFKYLINRPLKNSLTGFQTTLTILALVLLMAQTGSFRWSLSFGETPIF
jgi:uncharacterized membrane protein YphA (DoxX/SURF4 family)